MSEAVLDASALLALLNAEPGCEQVEKCLPGAFISAVNLAEVVSKLADYGMPDNLIRESLDSLRLEIVACDEEGAYKIGELRAQTKEKGLSLGDRACLALGMSLGIPVLTADTVWKELAIAADMEIRVIR